MFRKSLKEKRNNRATGKENDANNEFIRNNFMNTFTMISFVLTENQQNAKDAMLLFDTAAAPSNNEKIYRKIVSEVLMNNLLIDTACDDGDTYLAKKDYHSAHISYTHAQSHLEALICCEDFPAGDKACATLLFANISVILSKLHIQLELLKPDPLTRDYGTAFEYIDEASILIRNRDITTLACGYEKFGQYYKVIFDNINECTDALIEVTQDTLRLTIQNSQETEKEINQIHPGLKVYENQAQAELMLFKQKIKIKPLNLTSCLDVTKNPIRSIKF